MGELKWEDAFLNVNCLQIMYYLAKYNPSIEAAKIAEKFKMSPEEVEEKLVKLAGLKIVDYEKNKGYTLTDKGMMSLYNFHTNYNSR
ncbi:Uncharacterised protein [uncultured archaeon]|nr:Uncharacterised protein [uncultured archaeon]